MKNLSISLLLICLLVNGWSIIFLALPFYKGVIIAGSISIIIMVSLHERFVFLYAITLSLAYGTFLTIYAFIHINSSETQLLYMYSHLLFTSFLLVFWILVNFLKNIGYENRDLKRQVQLLQKYNGTTQILTVTEFKEQAQWLLKSSERNKEEAWLLRIKVNHTNQRIKDNLQEMLEKASLQTIRQKFDLVTSETGLLYFLLKNTHEDGVERVIERYWEKCQEELNFINPPFTVEKEHVVNYAQFERLFGGEEK